MSFSWLPRLYLNPERSDLEIQCVLENGDLVRFPVHSAIICAQSDLIRAMLSTDLYPETQTREIKIPLFSPRVVEYYVRFFYTNTIPRQILFEDLLNLLQLAHDSETQYLVDLCCSKLSSEICVDTVCEVYEIAKLKNLATLLRNCRIFASKFFYAIIKYDLHFSLGLESFKSILTPHQGVNDDNADLRLRAFKRWLNWNSCARGMSFDEIKEVFSTWSLQDDRSPYMTTELDNPWPCELYCGSDLSDTDIVIEGAETARFPVHSLVLNKHSEVFRRMWRESTPAEGQKYCHCLKQYDARTVEYFIRFLYTRFFPAEMSLKNLLSLCHLAHEFQVKELISKCEQQLLRKITLQNSCHVLAVTRNLSCRNVHGKCIEIASGHLETILSNYLHFALDEVLLTRVERASGLRLESSNNEYVQAYHKWRGMLPFSNLNENDRLSLVEIAPLV